MPAAILLVNSGGAELWLDGDLSLADAESVAVYRYVLIIFREATSFWAGVIVDLHIPGVSLSIDHLG